MDCDFVLDRPFYQCHEIDLCKGQRCINTRSEQIRRPHSQLHDTDMLQKRRVCVGIKIIQVPKQGQNNKAGIEMTPLPEDWITRVSYKNATYAKIVPRYTYKPGVSSSFTRDHTPTMDHYFGRKVKTYYMCFTTLQSKTESGEIISYNDKNKDWQVKYQDDTVIDIDADTLEQLTAGQQQ
jgi:hypothetical protein